MRLCGEVYSELSYKYFFIIAVYFLFAIFAVILNLSITFLLVFSLVSTRKQQLSKRYAQTEMGYVCCLTNNMRAHSVYRRIVVRCCTSGWLILGVARFFCAHF